MVKSLGDYNKESSSSSDLKNIKWSKKNVPNTVKPKSKNKKKIPPTNNLPTKNKKNTIEKIIKVETIVDNEKPKSKNKKKRFQESSASNSKIERGFRRPGR